MEALRNALRKIAHPFTWKAGKLPLGIWIVWLMLIYAAIAQRHRFFALAEDPIARFRVYSDLIIGAAALVAAIVALIMRRRITQVFGTVVCANLLVYTIYSGDWIGSVIAILGFAGLMINCRWFVAKLPNVW
jgi:hypothetical protein